MSTSNAQLIITARNEHLRVRGNAQGPITADDHRAFADAVAEAVENLDNKPSGEDAFLFAIGSGEPDAAVGRTDTVVLNTESGDIWQKQADGTWLLQFTIPTDDGGGGSFPDNAPPTAQAWLNLPAGSVIAGRPLVEVTMQALSQPEDFPGYTQPVATLGSNQSGDVECGTTINPTLAPGFSQGDAGALSSYQLQRGTTVLASDTTAPIEYPPLANSYQIGLETVTYTATFSYGQGVQKTGSQGTPAPGRIEAGAKQAQVSFRGLYRLFSGAAAAPSADSDAVRALPTQPLVSGGGQYVLNTGTASTTFEIHLPPGRALVSVVDLDALNKDITGEYLASTTDVEDAAGDVVTYTTRRKTQAVAYTTNHRHQVTYS